ncbi:glutathione S-transferase [Catenaria anguillulae PL171]|uniref:Glutathione S-transferase n=1 Tax=Catenaria anguillulae PL171 TaxID=765915 RepID=A0A1Y2H552_9FUNG|nr:glutathione S-transferase [Catenaria anguillulae PL171]
MLPATPPPVLKLYFSRMCPYVHRVTTTLHLLGILTSLAEGMHSSSPLAHVDLIHIDLANKPEWFKRDINPKGTVPVLIIPNGNGIGGNSVTLADSDDTTAYLLQVYAGNTRTALLRPQDALVRYTQAVPLLDTWNDEYVPAFYALLKEQDKAKVPAAQERLVAAVRAVEAKLAPASEGAFALGGGELTVVDILCGGFLARLPVLKHYRGFDVPVAECARFEAWRKAVVGHPSVQGTLAPVDELVVAYKRLAGEPTV